MVKAKDLFNTLFNIEDLTKEEFKSINRPQTKEARERNK